MDAASFAVIRRLGKSGFKEQASGIKK